VWEAYRRVKENRGAAGVDHQSLEDFGENLSSNLYKLWNRLASGSDFPPPVRMVEIPKAPFQQADGGLIDRDSGTPQGGVVSSVLSNLFLHYVFDKWMERNFPNYPFARYADDAVVHCRSETQARDLNARKPLDYVKADSRRPPISGIFVFITREHPSNWVDLIIMWENRSAMVCNITRPTNVRH
jgi:retron-type reverse transcriptase